MPGHILLLEPRKQCQRREEAGTSKRATASRSARTARRIRRRAGRSAGCACSPQRLPRPRELRHPRALTRHVRAGRRARGEGQVLTRPPSKRRGTQDPAGLLRHHRTRKQPALAASERQGVSLGPVSGRMSVVGAAMNRRAPLHTVSSSVPYDSDLGVTTLTEEVVEIKR